MGVEISGRGPAQALGAIAASEAADDETRRLSRAKYRHRARLYDRLCGPTWPIRERAVAALVLRPGDRVLDVGCGTGLSLAMLREAVGDGGRVWGVDHSREMLMRARARVESAGWRNVDLIEAAAQELALPAPVDALLFHYTHDVLRSPAALAALLAHARPGARVAIAGIKYFTGWLAPLNPWVYWKNRGYNGRPGELRTPWDRIAPRLTDWRWEPTQWGMGYLASGRVAAVVEA
ncbi:MAG: methyltransferase domain-containing protein [Rubrivivax sp.]|jgi:demethylmenaquinone methyltransferase/2-methoxy-6-polyprenyl-1,4-benzoquinol methylase|nr:methyltransferase domain-containing protein [Rubrivivax sp.]